MVARQAICSRSGAISAARNDSVWVSDNTCAEALARFNHINETRRRGSNVPGPLEFRRRLAKRRFNNVTVGCEVELSAASGPAAFGFDWKGLWQRKPRYTWQPPFELVSGQTARESSVFMTFHSPLIKEQAPLPDWLSPLPDQQPLSQNQQTSQLDPFSSLGFSADLTPAEACEKDDNTLRQIVDDVLSINVGTAGTAFIQWIDGKTERSERAFEHLLDRKASSLRIRKFLQNTALNCSPLANLQTLASHYDSLTGRGGATCCEILKDALEPLKNSKWTALERIAGFQHAIKFASNIQVVKGSRYGMSALRSIGIAVLKSTSRTDLLLSTSIYRTILNHLFHWKCAENFRDATQLGHLVLRMMTLPEASQDKWRYEFVRMLLPCFQRGTRNTPNDQQSIDMCAEWMQTLTKDELEDATSIVVRAFAEDADHHDIVWPVDVWLTSLRQSDSMATPQDDARWHTLYHWISQIYNPSAISGHFCAMSPHEVAVVLLRHWVPKARLQPRFDSDGLSAQIREVRKIKRGIRIMNPERRYLSKLDTDLIEQRMGEIERSFDTYHKQHEAYMPLIKLMMSLRESNALYQQSINQILFLLWHISNPQTVVCVVRNLSQGLHIRVPLDFLRAFIDRYSKTNPHWAYAVLVSNHLGRNIHISSFPTLMTSLIEDCNETGEGLNPIRILRLLDFRDVDNRVVPSLRKYRSMITKGRVELIHNMALLFADAQRLTPQVSFYCVRDLYDRLVYARAPVGSDITLALIHTALVRPIHLGFKLKEDHVAFTLEVVYRLEGMEKASILAGIAARYHMEWAPEVRNHVRLLLARDESGGPMHE